MLKFLAGIAAVGVALIGAEVWSSNVVMERMTELQETLVAPDGRRIVVDRSAGTGAVRRPGAATRETVEDAAFGWRVTYAMLGGQRLTCTYRLPGISCEDGWTVMWSRPIR